MQRIMVEVTMRGSRAFKFEVPEIALCHKLIEEVSSFYGKWVYIGRQVMVRKKDIMAIHYQLEGADEEVEQCEGPRSRVFKAREDDGRAFQE